MYARTPSPRHKHHFAKASQHEGARPLSYCQGVQRALCKGKPFFPQKQQKAINFSIQKTKRLRTAYNCAQPVYAPLLLLNIRKAHIQRSYKKLPLHCVPLRSQRTYASSLPCFIRLCKMRTFTLPFYFFTF